MKIKSPNGSYYWDEYLKDVPICQEISEKQDLIKEEVLNILNQNILIDHPNYKNGNQPLYYNSWKALPLSHAGKEYHNQYLDYIDELIKTSTKLMPKTYSIIKDMVESKEIISAMVSRVEPGTRITHHTEPKEYMKIHLPIICDPGCKMLVNREERVWECGKLLSFNAGEYHGVIHKGTSERVIFAIDVSVNYLSQYVPEIKNAYIK